MIFAELPIGARFQFFGKTYTKMGTSLACDEDRVAHLFSYNTFYDLGGLPGQHVVTPLDNECLGGSGPEQQQRIEVAGSRAELVFSAP